MKIYLLTLFPDFFAPFLKEGVVARAVEKGEVELSVINFRDFTQDKYHKVDDLPYGGGGGMVLQLGPIDRAYQSIPKEVREIATPIIPTPRAPRYDQAKAMELARNEAIIIISGHYKGIDERIFQLIPAERVSIGDYVLSGGELPSMIIMESIVRLIPRVLSDLDSALTDSFTYRDYLLGYPAYTRPESYKGLKVPQVLLGGNHAKIKRWRIKQALLATYKYRPELIDENRLSDEEKELLDEIKKEKPLDERGRNV